MMALADLFVHVYVLIDDALRDGSVPVPPRPGRPPACSDAEVLTLALVRHLLARPSARAFLAEVRRDWALARHAAATQARHELAVATALGEEPELAPVATEGLYRVA